MISINYVWVNLYHYLYVMRLSILIFVFPSPPPLPFAGKPTGNWLFSEPERGNNLNLTWVVWEICLSNRMLVLYILIWRSLKVKRSLQRADGSQEMTDIKFSVADLAFSKKLGHWIWHLGTAFEHTFSRGGGGGRRREYFSKPIFKCERGDKVAWGACRIDWSTHEINANGKKK